MPTITFAGTLAVQPTQADGSFPAGATSVPFATTPSPKAIGVDTGVQRRPLASPLAFAALSGVGATDTVTQGTFLYFRSNAPVVLQLTFANPAGGTTTAVVPVSGLYVAEFDPTKYLVGLAAEGTASAIEYLIGGMQ